MCDADKNCSTCEDFLECSTEFQNYIHDLEEATEDYPIDDSAMRWW